MDKKAQKITLEKGPSIPNQFKNRRNIKIPDELVVSSVYDLPISNSITGYDPHRIDLRVNRHVPGLSIIIKKKRIRKIYIFNNSVGKMANINLYSESHETGRDSDIQAEMTVRITSEDDQELIVRHQKEAPPPEQDQTRLNSNLDDS